MYSLDFLPDNLKSGAREICEMLEIELSKNGIPVTVQTGDMSIERTDGKVVITHNTKPQFFRLLSMLTEVLDGKYCESPRQTMLCYMADQSRNAVFTMPAAKQMVRCLAAMGFDSLMLYTEDTYEIYGQPYFGHMRGRWTIEELKEISAYGDSFGVEVIPCIQALAHIGRIARWPCFSDLFDCSDILMVGEEKTYEFLDDVFRSCADSFISRKINLGFDEAHLLGAGRYLDKHGYRPREEIMLEHLNRVCEIAKKYGFSPMMWSDMFFRIAFGGKYYVSEDEIPKEVIDKVPENLTLIYWDYYTTDIKKFSHMVKCHKQFNNPTAFAGGCHKWGGYVANNMVTYDVESMHIDKCLEYGLTQIMTTGWGDDGADAAHFSILPGLLVHAEKCYKGSFDRAWFDKRFENLFKIPMKPFEIMNEIDCPPGFLPIKTGRRPNFHKSLIFSDVLQGLYNKHMRRDEFFEFYTDMAQKLAEYVDGSKYSYLVETAVAAANMCAYKSALPLDIRQAYRAHDLNKLKNIAERDIPKAMDATEALLDAVEKQWDIESRAFGLEIQQVRLGGLRERLKKTARVILRYCNGEIDKIDELDQEVLYLDCRTEDGDDLTPIRISSNSGWHAAVSV